MDGIEECPGEDWDRILARFLVGQHGIYMKSEAKKMVKSEHSQTPSRGYI